METNGVWSISFPELESAIRAADKAALLVPPRILRRVIKQDRQVPGPGLRVPHRKSYVIRREPLLTIVERSELGINPDVDLPELLLLLARPEPEVLATVTRARSLLKYWRLLFHARVHVALDQRTASGQLTDADVRRRVEAIGPVAFEEIRMVLRAEDLLLPPVDERAIYTEFVCVYLELRHFAPALLPGYFPTIRDFEPIEKIVCQDVDGSALYEQTRIAGASDSEEEDPGEQESWVDHRVDRPFAQPRKPSERLYCKFMEKADRARARGNLVRSARLRWRAALVIGPKLARTARADGRADLERLAERLQAALELDADQAALWPDALTGLLQQSVHGIWTPEARLLYDLQKVCVDHERGVFKLDWLRWILSGCRKRLKRPLPSQREVLMAKHLHGAQRRLKSARLSRDNREQLSALLEVAVRRTEQRLRSNLRPRLARALDEVGMRPSNIPERVAWNKLIEELLDQVVDRGFLAMSDVRDAISRNNLKIHDVTQLKELRSGDQLLQTDRKLAFYLDGVYRRGEIYLRLPQSLSSLFFGTDWGRLLTLYGILPFGGAFVILAALHHVSELVAKLTGVKDFELTSLSEFGPTMALYVTLVGSVLLGLMHHPPFRKAVMVGLRAVFQVVRYLFAEFPAVLMRLPWVRAIVDSRAFRLFRRYAFKPLLFTSLLIAVLSLVARHKLSIRTDCGLFLAMNVLLNSRLGRNVDEMITDWVVRSWHHLRMRVFVAMFHAIADTFHQLLEALERFLYAVDEWLRFRTGENRLTVTAKAVLGLFWGILAYVLRFFVNLLIEPQINPIKHFPIVTVSHKVILPFQHALQLHLEDVLAIGSIEAGTIAFFIVVALPGVFGFLVWELKENWRLYAANRSPKLQPAVVGHHGENLAQLLRPGFHSGTIPKLFTKLRRADRKAVVTGNWTASRKHRDTLNHVRQRVRYFVERDFVTLLELSQVWDVPRMNVGEVRAGVNNLRIELRCPELSPESAWLAFEERSGRMMAGVSHRGWLDRLTPAQGKTFDAALNSLYKLSGVDLVREQIAACFDSRFTFELCDPGLLIRQQPHGEPCGLYDLETAEETIRPQAVGAVQTAGLPSLARRRVMFAEVPLAWTDWVATWEPRSPNLPHAPAAAASRSPSVTSPPVAPLAERG